MRVNSFDVRRTLDLMHLMFILLVTVLIMLLPFCIC